LYNFYSTETEYRESNPAKIKHKNLFLETIQLKRKIDNQNLIKYNIAQKSVLCKKETVYVIFQEAVRSWQEARSTMRFKGNIWILYHSIDQSNMPGLFGCQQNLHRNARSKSQTHKM